MDEDEVVNEIIDKLTKMKISLVDDTNRKDAEIYCRLQFGAQKAAKNAGITSDVAMDIMNVPMDMDAMDIMDVDVVMDIVD